MDSTLDLRLLGLWHASLNGTPLPPLPTRHTRTLLARLAVTHPQLVSRADLIGDLFPRLAPESAAQHLRTTVYYLRRAMGSYLVSRHDQIGLVSALTVRHDISAFEVASAPGASLATLGEALALYGGSLLEHPGDGWAAQLAQQLHSSYVDVLRRVVTLAQAAGRLAMALDAARRWATDEPWNEDAHLALIRALVERGDRAAAEAQIARARLLLRDEWGQTPDPAFAALLRAAARLPMPLDHRPPSTHPESLPALKLPPTPDEAMDFERLPLVGRDDELAQIEASWVRARQGIAQTLIVEGVAGVGKSRLLAAFVAHARLYADSVVLWGVANEQTASQAFGLLRDAVAHAPAVASTLIGQAIAALDDLSWGVLCRYLPEISAYAQGRAPLSVPALESLSEIARRDQVLKTFLSNLSVQGALLLVLESNDQGDAETLALPATLATARHRAMVVIARRPVPRLTSNTAPADHISAALVQAPVITLESLAPAATAELIRAALGETVEPDLLARLSAQSGGNPLFVREIMRAMIGQGALRWEQTGWRLATADLPLPDPVINLLAQRLAPLSHPARLLANLLATLGRPASNALLMWLWPHEESRLAAQAELLERRVLVERDTHLRFDHDWLRENLLTSLDETSSIALHARIAAALREHPDADRAERAQHYAGAHEWDAALADTFTVAGQALAEGRYPTLHQALALGEQALAALHVAPHDERRWQLLALRERYDAATMHGAGWLHQLDSLLALAEAAGQPAWRTEALIRRGQALQELGRYHEAEAVLRTAVAQADQAELPAAAALGYLTLGYILDSAGANARALSAGQAAAQAATVAGDTILQINALSMLGYLEARAGQNAAADARLTLLLTHPYLHQYPALGSHVQRFLGITKIISHRYEAGLALMHQSVSSAEAIGDVYQIFLNQTGLCVILMMAGFYAEARPLAEALLPTIRQLPEPRQASLILAFLSKVELLAGDAPRAWDLAHEALAMIGPRAMPEYSAGFFAFIARIALALGRYSEAKEAITSAKALLVGIAYPAQMITHVAAQVWLQTGQPERACAAARRAIAAIPAPGYAAMQHVEVLWEAADVLAEVEGPQVARPIWERAYALYLDDLAGMTSLQLRRTFLAGSPFYERLVGFRSDAPRRLVFLPLLAAPTGRPLHPDELALVVWTLHAPDDPASTVARRHTQLRRLAAEASAQSASVTIEALAEALAVAPRTVQRDLRQMQAEGIVVITRGQRSSGR